MSKCENCSCACCQIKSGDVILVYRDRLVLALHRHLEKVKESRAIATQKAEQKAISEYGYIIRFSRRFPWVVFRKPVSAKECEGGHIYRVWEYHSTFQMERNRLYPYRYGPSHVKDFIELYEILLSHLKTVAIPLRLYTDILASQSATPLICVEEN